eukprot:COSAG02_NODE_45212_length_359_cov_0.792308_1_plen_35_part_01
MLPTATMLPLLLLLLLPCTTLGHDADTTGTGALRL